MAFLRKSGPMVVAFGLTVAAALFNLLVTIHVYSLIGFPIYCAGGGGGRVYGDDAVEFD